MKTKGETQGSMNIRQQILDAATALFEQKGLHFTMDDIASSLHMAKKTIYLYFPSKEDLLMELLEYGFSQIDYTKKKILEMNLPLEEKIPRVIIALPEKYQYLDFTRLDELGEKYPTIARRLNEHLENGWEPILELLQQGIDQGVLRPVNLEVFKAMVTACIEYFVSQNALQKANVPYSEALQEMISIFMKGIRYDEADDA
jgi:AcrR family transcriptional regulator